MTAGQLDQLTATVLANYARDLANAPDGPEFEHLARRAEGRYSTNLGERERQLVDAERARRVAATLIGGATRA
jgi:GTP1/Obg family GTP-binding protein